MDVQLPPRYALDPTQPVLGEGGMGKVYKARDQVMDVPVAIKVVRPDLAADKRFRRLFDAEVRIAARFTHEHIVPLHDLGELVDGTPFLGLALADSGSFQQLQQDPTWAEVRRLVLELLDALAHLHSRDVLHRDLKPENVLLNKGADGQRHVWLADLGLAKASSDLARKKGRTEGTPGYMAPEQRLGLAREYGPWTDLFSVGVLLWELVTGKLPFGKDGSPLSMELRPLVPRKGLSVPDGLELILANVLAAEPLSRYDLAADLARELTALPEPTVDHAKAMAALQGPVVALVGTVAPSAPQPTPPPTSLSEDEPPKEQPLLHKRTWVPFDDDEPQLETGAPVWNRPLPSEIPSEPPPEPGLGGTARASLPLFALRELPLVARGAWRQLLWQQARETASAKHPGVLLVVGKAGAGKTHLVESVVRALEEGGWAESLTLRYQSPPSVDDGFRGAARSVIRPWNETRASLETRLQRGIARERGAHDEVVVDEASLLARWAGLLNDDEALPPMNLGLRRVYRYIEARAWRGLGLLVLDDVHLSREEGDGLTIAETVLASRDEASERPLLVIATLRAEDLGQDEGLKARVDALVEHGAVRVDLPPLDRAGTMALLEESLTLADDLAALVAKRCEGNPLFARQLLVEWSQRGWLVDTGGLRFGLAKGVDALSAIPEDAAALFVQRVQDLSRAASQPAAFLDVVQTAALASQTVPVLLLQTLAGDELWPELRSAGLWRFQEDTATFDHGMMHQALRAVAGHRDDVRDLHRRLADAWGEVGASGGRSCAMDVGVHAHAAGDWSRAVDALLRAADEAHRGGRAGELSDAAQLAEDACNQDRRQRWRAGWAKLWQARHLQLTGLPSDAAEMYFQAHQIFAHTEVDDGRVQALLGMGWAAVQVGRFDRGARRYSEAMKLADELGLKASHNAAILGTAALEQQKRNFEGAGILYTRALARYEAAGDVAGVARSLLGQALLARRTGRFDEATEAYDEAREAFEQSVDLIGVARTVHGCGELAYQLKKLDAAEEHFLDTMHSAEELGAAAVFHRAQLGLAACRRSRGGLERAERGYTRTVVWARRVHAFEEAMRAHLGLAHVRLMQRDLKAMLGHMKEVQRDLDTVPGHWLWAPFRLYSAAWHAMRGDEEKAWRALWSAQDLGLDDSVDVDVAFLLSVICNRSVQEGWERALRVAGKLALSQWDRLGRDRESERVERLLRESFGTVTPTPERR